MSIFSVNTNLTTKLYNKESQNINSIYDIGGNSIRVNNTTEIMFDNTWTDGNWNSFAKYGRFVVQIHADNEFCIFDIVAKTKITEKANIQVGHGESSFFGLTKYSEDDYFPLLYSADYYQDPQIVYVNRIQLIGRTPIATLIKQYTFPSYLCGYFGSCCFDAENNIVYLISYYQKGTMTHGNRAWEISENNPLLVSKWDMSEEYKNPDGTYTPKFIDKFTLPYVFCTQASFFYDNKIFIGAGVGSGDSRGEHIYIIDLKSKKISDIINLQNQRDEIEGIHIDKQDNGNSIIYYNQTHVNNGQRYYSLEGY